MSFSVCARDFCPFFLPKVFHYVRFSVLPAETSQVYPGIFNDVYVSCMRGPRQNLPLALLEVIYRGFRGAGESLPIWINHPLLTFSIMFATRIWWKLIESVLPTAWKVWKAGVAEQWTTAPDTAFLEVSQSKGDIFQTLFWPHCFWYLPFLNHIAHWGNGYLKTLSYLLMAFSCFLGINHFHCQSARQLFPGTHGYRLLELEQSMYL